MITFGKKTLTCSGGLEYFSIQRPPPELLKFYIHADLRSLKSVFFRHVPEIAFGHCSAFLFFWFWLGISIFIYKQQSKGTCNFEVFDSWIIMVSRSEFGYQDVWIMAAWQFVPSLFALLGSGYALVNKDWLQISLTLLESVHVCKEWGSKHPNIHQQWLRDQKTLTHSNTNVMLMLPDTIWSLGWLGEFITQTSYGGPALLRVEQQDLQGAWNIHRLTWASFPWCQLINAQEMVAFNFDLHWLRTQRENCGGKNKKKEVDNNLFPFLFLVKPAGFTQQAAKQYRSAFPPVSPPQQEPAIAQTVPWWEICLANPQLSSREVANACNGLSSERLLELLGSCRTRAEGSEDLSLGRRKNRSGKSDMEHPESSHWHRPRRDTWGFSCETTPGSAKQESTWWCLHMKWSHVWQHDEACSSWQGYVGKNRASKE